MQRGSGQIRCLTAADAAGGMPSCATLVQPALPAVCCAIGGELHHEDVPAVEKRLRQPLGALAGPALAGVCTISNQPAPLQRVIAPSNVSTIIKGAIKKQRPQHMRPGEQLPLPAGRLGSPHGGHGGLSHRCPHYCRRCSSFLCPESF